MTNKIVMKFLTLAALFAVAVAEETTETVDDGATDPVDNTEGGETTEEADLQTLEKLFAESTFSELKNQYDKTGDTAVLIQWCQVWEFVGYDESRTT